VHNTSNVVLVLDDHLNLLAVTFSIAHCRWGLFDSSWSCCSLRLRARREVLKERTRLSWIVGAVAVGYIRRGFACYSRSFLSWACAI